MTSRSAPRRLAPLALAGLLVLGVSALSSCTPGVTAAEAARAQVGVRYVYGGSSPSGFDCSGLTSWAWKQAGVTLPRTASAQHQATARISKADLQPGDLVFYGSGSVSHVAIYVGEGKIVQARKAGYPVEVQSIDWWASNRIGYGRVNV